MAGPSYRVGSLDIIATEISSCSEIESNINLQAIEATRDSDEVCGLEKKECDSIMEHLKNNPGLVVKSLGPEGRMVLHVAVMSGETEKPKPPISEHTNHGLTEAATNSEWYRALNYRNCKDLMDLLKDNSYLVAQTGSEGWTVLHVACFMGCLQLMDQVMELFKPNGHFEDQKFGVSISWTDIYKKEYSTLKARAIDFAWFTCPRQVLKTLRYLSSSESPYSSLQGSTSNADQHLRNKLVEIMEGETIERANHSTLENGFQTSAWYNFVLDRKDLRFHHACQHLRLHEAKDYAKAVIHGCLDLGPPESIKVLTYLLKLHNAQGETPFHAAASSKCIPQFLELLPRDNVVHKECLNAQDVRGWTVLHYVVAMKDYEGLKALLHDGRIDVNASTSLDHEDPNTFESGMMALHLAILHNDVESVKLLLEYRDTDVNATFRRPIMTSYGRIKHGEEYDTNEDELTWTWSPLQLAAIMGLTNVVRTLLTHDKGNQLKHHDIYDEGKLRKKNKVKGSFQKVSAILFAAASGNPNTLRLFLDDDRFDPLIKSKEDTTALHCAVYAMRPMTDDQFSSSVSIGQFLLLMDHRDIFDVDEVKNDGELRDKKFTSESYLQRKACITMLLQAGVDILDKDKQGRLAEPGPQAPEEAQLWWHEQMARETFEAKKSLNDAANAISVVATLVATASFVGPLQPPLGYGGDSMDGGIQDNYLSIRVFMVSNILSFYLAVASILFAVVPSLPMPQEGIYAEWQRTRRTVSVAIFFLLMSVLGVLISFGAASNSVVSEGYSWRHDGLSFYPTVLGGFICILGIVLFFLRLLRLVFNRNTTIRYLYKTFVKF